MPLADRPYHCTWADGSELSPSWLAELRDVHDHALERLQLEAGDVLVVDNLRVAHGRTPWEGGARQMGLMLSELRPRASTLITPPAAYADWANAAAGRLLSRAAKCRPAAAA